MEKRTPPWGGHRPTTAAVLIAILERTTQKGAEFSDTDRALYAACEFWAAAMHGTLREHLGGSALLRLHAAEVSFAVLGIFGVARVLHTARQQLTDAVKPLSLERVTHSVERQLALTDEHVDQLFANFSKTQRQAAAVEFWTTHRKTIVGSSVHR